MPHNIDDYIHIIGRTGSVGHAISFVTESDSIFFGNIIFWWNKIKKFPNELKIQLKEVNSNSNSNLGNNS